MYRLDLIEATTAIYGIQAVGVPGVDLVVARSGEDDVGTFSWIDLVVGATTTHHVIAGAATQQILPREGPDVIVSPTPLMRSFFRVHKR
jgi:hypothetical protein